MQYTSSIVLLAFAAANVFAHGVISEIQGANGVNMPGLSGEPLLSQDFNPFNNF